MNEPISKDAPTPAAEPPQTVQAAAPTDFPPPPATAVPDSGAAPAPEAAAESTSVAADGAAELEKLRKERDDLYNRYLRAVADLDNYRRRVAREKDELRQYAVSGLIESLVPVFENLRLAVASAQQTPGAAAIVQGVAMVSEQLRGALAGVGLSEINPEAGAEFDPHQHQSIAHTPSETVPEEHIAQVVRTGFALNGRIIRPASVVLSGGKPPPPPPTEPAEAPPAC